MTIGWEGAAGQILGTGQLSQIAEWEWKMYESYVSCIWVVVRVVLEDVRMISEFVRNVRG